MSEVTVAAPVVLPAGAVVSAPAAAPGSWPGLAPTPVASAAMVTGVEELEQPKFDFDAAFQSKIAALVVRDTQFVQRVDGLIKPEYFENGIEAQWVSVALRYYQRYKRVPADATIYARLIKEDVAAKIIDPTMALLMGKHYTTNVVGADLSDRDFVVDQVATFARHQAVSAAILTSVTDLDRRDFDKIAKQLRKALDTGSNSDADVYDFGEGIALRTGERLDRAAGKLPPTGITTGYAMIDDVLYHKGWGKRELSVIMGGAKAGKTTALLDFGIQAVNAGHKVLYITLEVAAKILAERADANISDTPVMELQDQVHTVKSKVADWVSRTSAAGGKLILKEFPSGSATVSDIRRLIERFKARSIQFDLIIVDYADIMSPERYTDNQQENSKSIYVGLRGLAMQEDLAMLTATQTNRDGFKAAVAKAEHVAEDFNKVRIADIIISINKTDEERNVGQARLYFAASRNQAGGFTIRIEQQLDRMKFISKVVGHE
jgi:replicative DNA helicase